MFKIMVDGYGNPVKKENDEKIESLIKKYNPHVKIEDFTIELIITDPTKKWAGGKIKHRGWWKYDEKKNNLHIFDIESINAPRRDSPFGSAKDIGKTPKGYYIDVNSFSLIKIKTKDKVWKYKRRKEKHEIK